MSTPPTVRVGMFILLGVLLTATACAGGLDGSGEPEAGVGQADAAGDAPANDGPNAGGEASSDENEDIADRSSQSDAENDSDTSHESASDPAQEDSPATIDFVSATSNLSEKTNTLTLSADTPLGIVEGDVLIAQFFARSDPVRALDEGWQLIDSENQHRQSVWIRVATEDEPATHTWMQGDPERLGRSGVIVAAYRGVDTGDPVAGYGHKFDTDGNRTLTAPSVDVEVPGSLVIHMWSTSAPGSPNVGIQPPLQPGLTERMRVTSDISSRAMQVLADSVQEEEGPSGAATATTTWDVSRSWNHTVVLRPAN